MEMSKDQTERTDVDFVAERLIHTAEALALSARPERRAAAERYRKILERQLERDRARTKLVDKAA